MQQNGIKIEEVVTFELILEYANPKYPDQETDCSKFINLQWQEGSSFCIEFFTLSGTFAAKFT